ncbi:MAG: hypothetical protein A2W00_13555 [Candidatus Eisenbacteria bacterium RBG_16_71_46]|nr:MAG: hypothetical protein A2W00_13555 [Candidatus Eisenbacteria bacterium RBG_16_71_46]
MVRLVRPARSRRRMLAATVMACACLTTQAATPASAAHARDARSRMACLAGVDLAPAKGPGPFVGGTAFAVMVAPRGFCRLTVTSEDGVERSSVAGGIASFVWDGCAEPARPVRGSRATLRLEWEGGVVERELRPIRLRATGGQRPHFILRTSGGR